MSITDMKSSKIFSCLSLIEHSHVFIIFARKIHMQLSNILSNRVSINLKKSNKNELEKVIIIETIEGVTITWIYGEAK